ncbi:unnamed protein product [Nippostrongylus brasiliensis]|uniref:t-SNARE coiled-coil homology domain-containing protein n=1 Tax=Nippostrongylus brasiliensis TaxID=27835 RepID=A0A0N4Y6T7_NIPBR|nr:unnamed protein product [Nippostrongylus brasiliensis]
MERELRLKAFIEEYARVVQLFDDIVSMKESMGRLETYMVVMVCQVGVAMIVIEGDISTIQGAKNWGFVIVSHCRHLLR